MSAISPHRPEHKTYALLRYVPTYWGLPAQVIPVLLMVSTVLIGFLGLYGVASSVAVVAFARVTYAWDPAVLTIVRASLQTLLFLRTRRRIRL